MAAVLIFNIIAEADGQIPFTRRERRAWCVPGDGFVFIPITVAWNLYVRFCDVWYQLWEHVVTHTLGMIDFS